MKRFMLFMIVAVVAAISGGCSTSQSGPGYFLKTDSDAIVFVDPEAPAMRKIALMPFKAPTELIGSSVSDLFVTEILKAQRYTLVERSQIKNVLGESELAMSGMTSQEAAQVGALLGADGVIVGTVDQYESKAVKGHAYPVVGITFRLIDCKTGKIAWSVDLARMAKSKEASLSTHGRVIVHEMMSGLYRNLIKYEPPADVSGLKVSELGLSSAKLTWNKIDERRAVCIVERAEKSDGPYAEVSRPSASRCCYQDTGLKDSSTYYYKVTAMGANGVKSRTAGPVETFTSPPPVPPAGVKAESGFVKCVPISWMQPKETMYVSGYIVMRSDSRDGPFGKIEEVKGVKTLSYNDGGVEPGSLKDASEYFYKVVTVNEAGSQSQPSVTAKASTRGLPPVVGSVMATSAKPREVPLSWEPSEDEKVAGYIISRSDGAACAFAELKIVPGRLESQWVDRGGERNSNKLGRLNDGSSYRYQVAAYNIGGARSEWSKVASAVTKKIPAKPAKPVCKGGLVQRIDLTWPENAESDIKHYLVSYSTSKDGKYKELGQTEACEFVQPNLDNGTEYFYKLKAVDADTLESEWSESGFAATKPCPSAPSALAAMDTNLGFMLKWSAPANKDVTSYVVHKKTFLGKTGIGFADEPEFLLTPEQVGKSIEVYVTAKDKDGLESEYSEACMITATQ